MRVKKGISVKVGIGGLGVDADSVAVGAIPVLVAICGVWVGILAAVISVADISFSRLATNAASASKDSGESPLARARCA